TARIGCRGSDDSPLVQSQGSCCATVGRLSRAVFQKRTARESRPTNRMSLAPAPGYRVPAAVPQPEADSSERSGNPVFSGKRPPPPSPAQPVRGGAAHVQEFGRYG